MPPGRHMLLLALLALFLVFGMFSLLLSRVAALQTEISALRQQQAVMGVQIATLSARKQTRPERPRMQQQQQQQQLPQRVLKKRFYETKEAIQAVQGAQEEGRERLLLAEAKLFAGARRESFAGKGSARSDTSFGLSEVRLSRLEAVVGAHDTELARGLRWRAWKRNAETAALAVSSSSSPLREMTAVTAPGEGASKQRRGGIAGGFMCYRSRDLHAGFGHQLIAMSYLYGEFGEFLRILDPHVSHHDTTGDSFTSIFISEFVVAREELCRDIVSGYEEPGIWFLIHDGRFAERFVAPFLHRFARPSHEICPQRPEDAWVDGVGLKVRAGDQRLVNHDVGEPDVSDQYCPHLASTDRCVVMTDQVKATPCFNNCVLLDSRYTNMAEEDRPSLLQSLMCNIRTLARQHSVVTNSESNLQFWINAERILAGRANDPMWDIFRNGTIDTTVGLTGLREEDRVEEARVSAERQKKAMDARNPDWD
jgi:hypothetical protein